MNANEFDALMGQGFNTMEKSVASGANNMMGQQAINNVQAFQSMPTAKGYVPDHTVLPIFKKQFYVLLNNVQKGPLTYEQLKGLAIADIIDENTQVWQEGLPEWKTLKTLNV